MLTVNEELRPLEPGMLVRDLVRKYKPGANIFYVNGQKALLSTPLREGDICNLIKEHELPTVREMENTLARRHGWKNQKILSRSCVGIMGLGGLGSSVAVSLVKMGVGRLIIADHDVVDLSNIHRQHYFLDQIGQPKTKALKSTLIRSNPFVVITPIDKRLDSASIQTVFRKVDVLVECFDDAQLKAEVFRTVRKQLPHIAYVGSSGVAGFGSGITITSRKIDDRVYMIGDFESDVDAEGSLTATRVGIAAQLQAHQVIRILLGLETDEQKS